MPRCSKCDGDQFRYVTPSSEEYVCSNIGCWDDAALADVARTDPDPMSCQLEAVTKALKEVYHLHGPLLQKMLVAQDNFRNNFDVVRALIFSTTTAMWELSANNEINSDLDTRLFVIKSLTEDFLLQIYAQDAHVPADVVKN